MTSTVYEFHEAAAISVVSTIGPEVTGGAVPNFLGGTAEVYAMPARGGVVVTGTATITAAQEVTWGFPAGALTPGAVRIELWAAPPTDSAQCILSVAATIRDSLKPVV